MFVARIVARAVTRKGEFDSLDSLGSAICREFSVGLICIYFRRGLQAKSDCEMQHMCSKLDVPPTQLFRTPCEHGFRQRAQVADQLLFEKICYVAYTRELSSSGDISVLISVCSSITIDLR